MMNYEGMNTDQAYQDGRDHASDGLPGSANPFSPLDYPDLHDAWWQGWLDYRDEREVGP